MPENRLFTAQEQEMLERAYELRDKMAGYYPFLNEQNTLKKIMKPILDEKYRLFKKKRVQQQEVDQDPDFDPNAKIEIDHFVFIEQPNTFYTFSDEFKHFLLKHQLLAKVVSLPSGIQKRYNLESFMSYPNPFLQFEGYKSPLDKENEATLFQTMELDDLLYEYEMLGCNLKALEQQYEADKKELMILMDSLNMRELPVPTFAVEEPEQQGSKKSKPKKGPYIGKRDGFVSYDLKRIANSMILKRHVFQIVPDEEQYIVTDLLKGTVYHVSPDAPFADEHISIFFDNNMELFINRHRAYRMPDEESVLYVSKKTEWNSCIKKGGYYAWYTTEVSGSEVLMQGTISNTAVQNLIDTGVLDADFVNKHRTKGFLDTPDKILVLTQEKHTRMREMFFARQVRLGQRVRKEQEQKREYWKPILARMHRINDLLVRISSHGKEHFFRHPETGFIARFEYSSHIVFVDRTGLSLTVDQQSTDLFSEGGSLWEFVQLLHTYILTGAHPSLENLFPSQTWAYTESDITDLKNFASNNTFAS